MSLKKLSFILLMLLSYNSYTMEEPNHSQKKIKFDEADKQTNNEINNQPSIIKPTKVKKLKFYCAKLIFENKISTENLYPELQDYLKYFDKKEELGKYALIPIFKKYLRGCFDNLSLEELKEILNIFYVVYKISPRKCTFLQRHLPNLIKIIFCDNYLVTILKHSKINLSQREFSKLIEDKKKQIEDIKANLSAKDQETCNRLNLMLLNLENPIITQNSPIIEGYIALYKNNRYVPALYRLGLIQNNINLTSASIISAKELMKVDALNYAVGLAAQLCINTITKQHFSNPIFFLENIDFCNFLNEIIKLITNPRIYKSEYDFPLTIMYNYLGDIINTKTHAEKYLKENEGIFNPSILVFLVQIYKKEGDSEKEKFYNDLLKKDREYYNQAYK